MYLAIDVGGTKTALCLFDSLTNPQIIHQDKFININDFEKDYAQLIQKIQLVIGSNEIKSIGTGLPGILSTDKTQIIDSGNLTSWQGKNIKKLLESEFKVPVFMDQDVSNAALGEYTYGNHNRKEFMFLIWGTGFGGAKVYKNSEKIIVETMEVGYQVITKESEYEFLEFNIGGNGIQNKFGKRAENLNENEWEIVLQDLTTGLYNMQVLSGVKTFIIGGGIALKQKEKISILQQKLRKRLEILLNFETAEIILSKLGEEAGLYGSLALQNKSNFKI